MSYKNNYVMIKYFLNCCVPIHINKYLIMHHCLLTFLFNIFISSHKISTVLTYIENQRVDLIGRTENAPTPMRGIKCKFALRCRSGVFHFRFCMSKFIRFLLISAKCCKKRAYSKCI